MAEDKDYFGEKLRLAERAREDAYFRRLDQALLAQMRQQDRIETTAAPQAPALFPSILVPVDFSPYAASALRYALGIADRFASSLIVLHVIPHETTTYAVSQRLGHRNMPFLGPLRPQNAPTVPPEVAEEVVLSVFRAAETKSNRPFTRFAEYVALRRR